MAATRESQIFLDLMRFKPTELSPNAWAVKAGVSRTVWSDMRRHGNPSRRTLEKLLAVANSSLAEFEALRLGPVPRPGSAAAATLGDPSRGWRPASLLPLPLIASSLGGDWGEPGSQIELTEIRPDKLLDRLERPRSLAFDPDAYAVTVVGDSMWPRFRPGSRIALSPRSPVAIGDDVAVLLRSSAKGTEGVLIKQLVKKSATGIELRQHNPDRNFTVGADELDTIVKVVGELI